MQDCNRASASALPPDRCRANGRASYGRLPAVPGRHPCISMALVTFAPSQWVALKPGPVDLARFMWRNGPSLVLAMGFGRIGQAMAEKGLDLAPPKRAIARLLGRRTQHTQHRGTRAFETARDMTPTALMPPWSAVGGMRGATGIDTSPGAWETMYDPRRDQRWPCARDPRSAGDPEHMARSRRLLQSTPGRFCSGLRPPSASSDHLSLRASVRLLSLSINRSFSALDEPVIHSEPPH